VPTKTLSGHVFRRVGSLCRCGVTDVPGQEFRYAVDRVIGDAAQDVAEVGLRVQAVQFGRTYQAVDRSGALTARVRPGEEIVLPSESDGA
jgi:hypothetical protein